MCVYKPAHTSLYSQSHCNDKNSQAVNFPLSTRETHIDCIYIKILNISYMHCELVNANVKM